MSSYNFRSNSSHAVLLWPNFTEARLPIRIFSNLWRAFENLFKTNQQINVFWLLLWRAFENLFKTNSANQRFLALTSILLIDLLSKNESFEAPRDWMPYAFRNQYLLKASRNAASDPKFNWRFRFHSTQRIP